MPGTLALMGAGPTGAAALSYTLQVLATAGLVGYWRLGESGAGVRADSSGNGRDLDASGTVNSVTGALASDANNAAGFPATSDRVQRPSDDVAFDIRTGSFSWELWLKTAATAAGQILRKTDSGAGNGIIWDLNRGGAGVVSARIHNSPQVEPVASGTWNDNAWHHLVLVIDRTGATAKIYIDGTQRVSSSITGLAGIDLNAAGALQVPGSSGAGIVCSVDELAAYNVALDATTVADHYAAGIA